MVSGAPGWANGGREPRYAPKDPSDYADFVTAAAKRYPAVHHWMIWGEPTNASNFQPLADDRLRPLRGARLAGPKRYARILDASYAALKQVSPRNLVIGGNSFTVGTVTPLRWIQALKLPGGKPPRMDRLARAAAVRRGRRAFAGARRGAPPARARRPPPGAQRGARQRPGGRLVATVGALKSRAAGRCR